MRTTLILTAIFFSVLFGSCQGNENEILELRVNNHREVGYGFIGPRILYLVQIEEEIGGEEWDRTFSIEDFEYEWGYTYNILVEKDYYDEVRLDAPSFRYIFLKELSRKKVKEGTQFDLILQRTFDDGSVESFVEGSSENGFSILGTKPFDCADLCVELSKENGAYTALQGTFQFTEELELKLIGLESYFIK